MKRHLSILAALAIVVAACAQTSGDSTTTAPGDTTTPTTTAPQVEAVLLSYSLSAGDEYQYEVVLDQHIDLNASGDPGLMGDEEIPGEASMDVVGSATITHVVSDGPEPGTYEVHITGEFGDVRVSGTADGEPIAPEEAPDFASLDPIDVTVVVDEQGNLVQEDLPDAEDPLAGMFGDLGPLAGGPPAPGLDPGQFIGPPFSDEEVAVGDTWTKEIESPWMGDPIVTDISSTVTGIEDLDGTEVYVIASNSTTSPIEFDLAEFFAGMFGALAPEGATPEETAELEAMLAQLQFLISIDGTTADNRTWFDVEAGISRQAETTSSTAISMDMNIPDEETGEMVGFAMDMSLDQDMTYRLISGPSA